MPRDAIPLAERGGYTCEMGRPAKEHPVDTKRATDSDRMEAASLAAKVTGLPHRLEPRAGQLADLSHSDAPAAARSSRLFGKLVHWLARFVTISLVVIAFLRIVYHDGTHFLTCLNAFTRYVYLPAYVCLAWAVWKRRWLLMLANIAVISLHVAWLAPDFIRERRFDSVSGAAVANTSRSSTVRIFFANVCGSNTEYSAMLKEIIDAKPDVIVLVEFTPNWHMAYLHLPFFAGYPYGSGMKNETMGTVNVFSKLPLASDKQNWFGGRGIQTIEIPVGSETLHLIGLHAPGR